MEALEAERKKQAEAVGAIDDGEKKSKKKSKDSIPKLDKIKIKKMKPTQLKEQLKLRGKCIHCESTNFQPIPNV